MPTKLCQCHAKGCIEESSTNPSNGELVTGFYLTDGRYREHQLAEAIWKAERDRSNIARIIADTTLEETPVSDASITRDTGVGGSRAVSGGPTAGFLQDQRASSLHRAGGGPPPRHPSLQTSAAHGSHDGARQRTEQQTILAELGRYGDQFLRSKAHFDYPVLQFETPPSSATDPASRISATSQLREANKSYLGHLDEVTGLRSLVQRMGEHHGGQAADIRRELLQQLSEHVDYLEGLVNDAWYRKKLELGFILPQSEPLPRIEETAILPGTTRLDSPIPVLLSAFTALVMALIVGISRDHANFLLRAIQMIVIATCSFINSLGIIIPESQIHQLASMPTDIRTLYNSFKLEGRSVRYACCKRCFACYAPLSPDNPRYPERCIFKLTPESAECGAELLRAKEKGGGKIPFREFVYQPVSSWIASLLSRDGIEDCLITSPKHAPPGGREDDIWDGSAFASFKGPDGQSFFKAPKGECRLVFSLFVDWFNPFGNRASSTKSSIGAIYMICLNLPPHMRYKMENVYLVGIIPGPSEPKVDELNHLIKPLVDDMLELWNPGVLIRQTANYPSGRMSRAAIIPLICDLPALRKTAGFMGHSGHHFCSCCKLQKEHIANVDFRTWPKRTWEEHLNLAIQYRDAQSEGDRTTLFKAHGVRWSELLRLSYWDVIKYSVVDSMHNLFLGDLHRHCSDIWHMSPKQEHLPEKVLPHSPEEQTKWIGVTRNALQTQDRTLLMKARHGYLLALARACSVPLESEVPYKNDIADALMKWRQSHPHAQIVQLVAHPFPVSDFARPYQSKKDVVLDGPILKEIWADIAETILPSWMGRAPKHLGKPGQGRLKADQWRTACMVHLPITLIRLWGRVEATIREKNLLNNFLYLVIAVRWATMRSTSQNHRTIIQENLYRYLTTAIELFGKEILVVNHHMSLHLVDCLQLFGPVHGWWAFPFERYNGIMQRFKTNNKIGQLEFTFFDSFTRAANFRALMNSRGVSSLLESFQRLFETFFGTYFHGSVMSDILAMRTEAGPGPDTSGLDVTFIKEHARPLDPTIYQALIDRLNHDASLRRFAAIHSGTGLTELEPVGQFCSKVTIKGVSYEPTGSSKGDSLILYRPVGQHYHLPAVIEDIFVHRHPDLNKQTISDVFLAIKPFLPLSQDEAWSDPYRQFPLLGAMLYSRSLQQTAIIVKASQIDSHFASCPYRDNPCQQVVLSLCRVGPTRRSR